MRSDVLLGVFLELYSMTSYVLIKENLHSMYRFIGSEEKLLAMIALMDVSGTHIRCGCVSSVIAGTNFV